VNAPGEVSIETARLRLRRLGASDLGDFAALHADPAVTEFVSTLDREGARERLDQDAEEWERRGHGLLAIVDLQTGDFLGRCGLRYWPQFDETEVGWILRREAWGRGYATEAGRACIDWGFSELELSYLTAMISPGNHRSARVAERLGMAPTRNDHLLGDPVVVYRLDRAIAAAG
jgi:RimJ/RimL family protein N-acetyltransferase